MNSVRVVADSVARFFQKVKRGLQAWKNFVFPPTKTVTITSFGSGSKLQVKVKASSTEFEEASKRLADAFRELGMNATRSLLAAEEVQGFLDGEGKQLRVELYFQLKSLPDSDPLRFEILKRLVELGELD